MIKRISLVIVFILIAFIGGGFNGVKAEFQPILPFEGSIIGLQYNYRISGSNSYFGSAYDWSSNKQYYKIGNSFSYKGLNYDLKYSYWVNTSLPGYCYEEGFTGRVDYPVDLDHNLSFSLFSGEVGQNFSEEIKTDFLKIKYSQILYYDWEKEAKLYLKLISGRARDDERPYYIANILFPVKYKDLSFISRFGYIKGGESLIPQYDLASYIRGYRSNVEEGNRMISFGLDKQIPLFLESDKPVLSLLNGSIFINLGDVLTAGERLSQFKVHGSAGAGLVLNAGQVDFRLDAVVTDREDWQEVKPVLSMEFVY